MLEYDYLRICKFLEILTVCCAKVQLFLLFYYCLILIALFINAKAGLEINCNFIVLILLFQEKVLHNVMTIFTFMGASVMRQDDSYSFEVITKTLDTVIPALIQVCECHHAFIVT